MNSAARIMNQGVVTRSLSLSIALSRLQMAVVGVTVLALASALSVIYVTNCSRTVHAAIQQGVAERNHLRLEWGQLLLERGTYDMQARVQQIAHDKLGMMIPESKSIIIISE
jgi:cell division protein FtsL